MGGGRKLRYSSQEAQSRNHLHSKSQDLSDFLSAENLPPPHLQASAADGFLAEMATSVETGGSHDGAGRPRDI